MLHSPPPGTVVLDALDIGKVNELYDKYKIVLLEFKGCDELLKTRKISADKRKADKQRYRNKMNNTKCTISNLGLDCKCLNISMLELNTDLPLLQTNGPQTHQISPPVWPVTLAWTVVVQWMKPKLLAPEPPQEEMTCNVTSTPFPICKELTDSAEQARVSIGGKSIPESTYMVDGQDFRHEQGHSHQVTPQDVRMEWAQSTKTGSESDSTSSDSDSSSSGDDPVNATVDDGMHPPNPDETRSILDDAEDEEIMAE
ncbi:hypothetical protein PILCRDRAFT_83756 [Piloderma croceum F 1598]|uniref:Uncharacterized protein n=1 Tax=Piloderma croceum (strain F 1598) TaxID=765440 RepID=A0A0C3BYF2_PILCF|nr:hypothetical protein PILCRDRAFT_83756 [Piloderma croceum F 1598]